MPLANGSGWFLPNRIFPTRSSPELVNPRFGKSGTPIAKDASGKNSQEHNAPALNQNGGLIMLSVNTNVGAMAALQFLNQTQNDLQMTQSHINSGLKVANAKDNGAIYAIAQNMRGNVAGYAAVSDSLNRGMSTVDVAISAGQSISDLLNELKGKALAAADASEERR